MGASIVIEFKPTKPSDSLLLLVDEMVLVGFIGDAWIDFGPHASCCRIRF